MKNQLLKMLSFVAAVLLVSQPAMAQECDPREGLFEAAAKARVPINYEQAVTTTTANVAFAGTSVAGFEQVSATQLTRGADAGFIYLNAPASGIPAGYYRVHARAAAPRLGAHEGSVSLIGVDGKEVARLPAAMETWSMEVPRQLPFPRTVMDANVVDDPMAESLRRITITITIRCPNGTTITIRFNI